ncbi:reverse transcriptase domain-containing protein, partial [Tanacetum coccineum]
KVVEDVGEDEDFKSGLWVSATDYVNANGGTISSESPPELQRSWCVKGHIRFGVISSVLMQQYQKTTRQRSSGQVASKSSSGTSDTYEQTRSASKRQRTSSKSKEPANLRRSRRLKDWSTTKEKARRERPKPAPFTQRITRFKYHQRAKPLQNIRVYQGNKDPEDHLGIFSAVAEQEEWPMPVWCKMFRQTLGGAAQNWFDDLDPKSVDSFKELSQQFLEEFSQKKDMPKTPQRFTA